LTKLAWRLVKVVNRNLYIYEYIFKHTMRKILIHNGSLKLTDAVECVFEKSITCFGTGAKIDAPKEFLGRRVYVLVRK